MKLLYEESFKKSLKSIIYYKSKDKALSAKNFKQDLKNRFEILCDNSYMYRKSIYFDDDYYRDFVYKGYTIIYKIEKDFIRVLDIFKWQDR